MIKLKMLVMVVLLFSILGCGKSPPKQGDTFTNSIDMKFTYIPPGKFMMGNKFSVEEMEKISMENSFIRYDDFRVELPQHPVEISKGFYMGIMEVSQLQYDTIMNKNPSYFKDPDNPVEEVSWLDAVKFCKILSEKEGITYRLPTEAEWEYACRAGTTTPYYTGTKITRNQANFAHGNKEINSLPVGSFPANNFGLHDMHGNVWEWCQDWYDERYYANSPTLDPLGPPSGRKRVIRSGSWDISYLITDCRSAVRDGMYLDDSYYNLGFRVVRELNNSVK